MDKKNSSRMLKHNFALVAWLITSILIIEYVSNRNVFSKDSNNISMTMIREMAISAGY